MAEADEDALELKLLSDPAYGEEFDTVVDEITDEYVKNELRGDERERVEQYFLTTTERQQKLEFASELLRRAEVERGKQTVLVPQTASPGLLDQIRAFFKQQAFARLAMTAAALVIVAGLIYIPFRSGNPGSSNYAPVTLTSSSSDRATGGAARTHVPMPEAGLRLNLVLPEEQRDATAFYAKLIDENRSERNLSIESNNKQTITVLVPANWLRRGMFLIQVESLKADGSRPRGAYQFAID